MPQVDVVFFQDDDGAVPVQNWIMEMGRRDPRIAAKLQARIALLQEQGHELRRPHADLLRDGIYELRVGFGSVNYRILYFFHGRTAAILAHGLTKEAEVPSKDIDLALLRKQNYLSDPIRYGYVEEENEEANE